MALMKLLLLDIETTPATVYTWALHKQDIGVDQIITPTSVLCWSAKWLDEKEVMFSASVKQSGAKFNIMVKRIHTLLCAADAVCHFNGNSFDIPRLNQEFLRLGLPPPPPIPQIDLKTVVMKKFSMVSSKLAFVGPYLKIGEKVKHEGWPLWIGCLAGNTDCWQRMEKYNRQDVILLEKLYHKVLPWIDNHPNRGLIDQGDDFRCPNCGSHNLRSNGKRFSQAYVYRRWQCLSCGKWSKERLRDKTFKPPTLVSG